MIDTCLVKKSEKETMKIVLELMIRNRTQRYSWFQTAVLYQHFMLATLFAVLFAENIA